MSQVNLEIKDPETLIAFIEDAKKVGLLKDISTEQVKKSFSGKTFPIRVPVDLDAVLKAAGNRIVKTAFAKTIQDKTVDILNKALNPAE